MRHTTGPACDRDRLPFLLAHNLQDTVCSSYRASPLGRALIVLASLARLPQMPHRPVCCLRGRNSNALPSFDSRSTERASPGGLAPRQNTKKQSPGRNRTNWFRQSAQDDRRHDILRRPLHRRPAKFWQARPLSIQRWFVTRSELRLGRSRQGIARPWPPSHGLLAGSFCHASNRPNSPERSEMRDLWPQSPCPPPASIRHKR